MKRMKWTALVAVVVMLVSMLAVSASAEVGLAVAPAAAVQAGDEVVVNVSLPADSAVMGATFEITYDNTVMSLKSAENGKLFSTFVGTDASTIGANPFRVSVVNAADVTAAGVVFTLTFTVDKAAAAGNYAVSVAAVKAVNSAEETVSVASGSCNVTVEKSSVVLGDVNGDGSVSLFDVLRLLNYLNSPNAVEIVEANSDVNGNGSVGLTDAIALLVLINK